MTNFQRTASWLAACGKHPNESNLSLQLGCDLEETVEFLQCVDLACSPHMLIDAQHALGMLTVIADGLKSGKIMARINPEKRAEALDALCDREVTGNGVALFAGFKKDEADQAVLNANDAKLVDGKPVILEGGKIGKPEGWTPPDHSNHI